MTQLSARLFEFSCRSCRKRDKGGGGGAPVCMFQRFYLETGKSHLLERGGSCFLIPPSEPARFLLRERYMNVTQCDAIASVSSSRFFVPVELLSFPACSWNVSPKTASLGAVSTTWPKRWAPYRARASVPVECRPPDAPPFPPISPWHSGCVTL